MKLTKNPALKQKFLLKLQKRYDISRTGIHVSDLVYCLREAYWKKKDPQPQTVKTLSFFVDGARRHEALQELLDVDSEVEVEKYGVVGHVDMLEEDLFNFIPVEVKTTRSQNSLPEHYLKQLGFYAVLLGVKSGCLVIQRLINEDPWEFYLVEWTHEEITELEEEMKHKASLLQNALKNETPEILPKAEQTMNWKCQNCLYKQRCGDETDATEARGESVE